MQHNDLQNKQKQEQKHPHTITDSSKSLNTRNVITLCFLALVGSAMVAARVTENIHKTGKPQNSDKMNFYLDNLPEENISFVKEEVYREICTNTDKLVLNKADIAVGSTMGGMLLPKSCMTGDLFSCLVEAARYYITPTYPGRDELRDQMERAFSAWSFAHDQEWKQLRKCSYTEHFIPGAGFYETQNPGTPEMEEYDALLNNIIESVNRLKQFSIMSDIAKHHGNCAEHTQPALLALLQKKVRYGFDMKIQLVEVAASSARFDHAYLLLDSNEYDYHNNAYRNDPDGVHKKNIQTMLNNILTGKICDPWNYGYFADFSTDVSGLYKNGMPWDYIQIKTYSLSFDGLEKLSTDAQKLVCNDLKEMGLDVLPRSRCRMFHNPIVKAAEITVLPEVQQEQLCLKQGNSSW